MMHGTAPLTARLEPWMEKVISDPDLCQELIKRYGSPLNLHDYSSMGRNIAELRAAAEAHEIDFQIYLARKANKTLGAIDKAMAEGCGIDVASYNELDQCLNRGVPTERLIVTAAVKSAALLRLAVEHGVVISLDNVDEATELLEIAGESEQRVAVALRLASDNPAIPPTRFGLRADQWLSFLEQADKQESSRLMASISTSTDTTARSGLCWSPSPWNSLAICENLAKSQPSWTWEAASPCPISTMKTSGLVSGRRSPNCQRATNP